MRLENNLVLSPMAGYSDIAFRALCRRHGAGLVCTEMVAAPSVNHDDRVSARKMTTRDEERPVSVQVFGNDPDDVYAATQRVEDACEIIGFNFGCPAPQIKRAGCGAALLDHPALAQKLVRRMRDATDKPLLVKMRVGNKRPLDIAAFGRRMEDCGADALILHGRTAAQMYSGAADWSYVAALKDAVTIPVIGNGDIVDGPSARRALEESGVDGLAVGRAALGNPRIFDHIRRHLAGGTPGATTVAERVADYEAYVELAQRFDLPLSSLRNQALRFAKGFPGARDLRVTLHDAHDAATLLEGVRAVVTPGGAPSDAATPAA